MIGRRIEHYRILDEIGRGHWGVVYRARDEDLRCDVAVKVVPPRTFADLVSREAARREVLALARLNHPAVVVIHRWVQEPDGDCVVMEFVQGESLEQKLLGGALPEAETVRLGIDMARGLAAVHEAGVIHRDLKPSNLRVRPDGLLKIVDFGLAKHTPAGEDVDPGDAGSEGGGTAPYVAPEVWDGKPASQASDLYAAGVVLYEMATGVHPFRGFPGPIAHATLHLAPPTPRERNPALSLELEAVILRLLRKDPAQRFPSAAALAEALESIHARNQAAGRPRLRWPVVAGVVAALLLAGAIGWWVTRGRGRIEHALAVLVPENPRGDPEQNHLAVAVTDALISGFGRVPRLRVTSLTSVLHYLPPAPRQPIRQIAQELGVDRVVEGSMLVFDGRMRLALRLYSTGLLLTGTREERLIWSGTLDGDRRDVFGLQSHVADSIARVIGLRLEAQGPGETSADPAANEEYYQGRYEWNRRSDESIRRALEHFQRAVALDSSFALAYSGLADAWATAGIGGMIPPPDAAPPAKRAAQRALALNPDLSEAWVSLGNIQQNFDWNWKGAEHAYRKAIELNPNNAHAHHWYANHLALRGRFDPAIVEIRRAQELDPLSLPVNIGAGAFLYYARRYEESLVEYRRVFDLDSTSTLLNRAMAATYIRLGRDADAARAIQRWLDHDYPGPLATRAAEGYRAGGLAGMVRVLIGALEVRRAEGHYGPATHVAELYSLLPDRERALIWLALAYEEHDTQLNRLRVDPIFDPLRGDARFTGLMRKVGLASTPRCGAAPGVTR